MNRGENVRRKGCRLPISGEFTPRPETNIVIRKHWQRKHYKSIFKIHLEIQDLSIYLSIMT